MVLYVFSIKEHYPFKLYSFQWLILINSLFFLQLEISKYLFNSIFTLNLLFRFERVRLVLTSKRRRKNLPACGNFYTGTARTDSHCVKFKKVRLADRFWLQNNATITACGSREDQAPPLPFPFPRVCYHDYFNLMTFILCFKFLY